MEDLEGPDRLAHAVRERRLELGIPTGAALARLLGLSQRLVGEIENGRRGSYSAATLRTLDSALGWWVGSSRRLLDGVDDVPRVDSRRQIPSAEEIERVIRGRQDDTDPAELPRLITVLDLGAGRLEGLTDDDIKDIELAAKMAASDKARQLQADRRHSLGDGSMEAMRHSVDMRSATGSPARTTTP